MDELEVGRIVLLWLWCFGLACIEIEIEGGYGWVQRLPTWWLSRGIVGRIYAMDPTAVRLNLPSEREFFHLREEFGVDEGD